MKTDDERDLERVTEIASLPTDSPERVRWERDPRRHTLLRSYLDFLEAEPAEGSRPADARDQLAQFLGDKIERAAHPGTSVDPAATHAERSAAPAGRRPRSARTFWRRSLVAAAAVVLIAVGIRLWTPGPMGPTGVQRGDDGVELELMPARVLAERLDLQWTPMPDADGYVVILYRVDLTEIHRLDAVSETSASVARQILPVEANGQTVVWRVEGMLRGDVIGQSPLGYIDLSGSN